MLGYWCAEVWVFKKYTASYLGEQLDTLTDEINLHHGKDEEPYRNV